MSLKTKPKTEIVSVPFTCAAGSDIGSCRDSNQDAFILDPGHGFFLVVDGMGGHEQGEAAAQLALETIQTGVRKIEGSAAIRLRDSIILANNVVFENARVNSIEMGCVLTSILIDGDRITVGHVGDTRLYKIRGGAINKLTTDHSLVGELEETGSLSEQRLMRHSRRNEVTRSVGIEKRSFDDEGFADIFTVSFESDSAFLLCSDGLSDLLTSAQILEIIEENSNSLQDSIEKLIAEANRFGGKDNITALLVSGRDFFGEVFERRSRVAAPKKKKFGELLLNRWIIFIGGALAGAALAYLLLRSLVFIVI